jgi:ligand-binding sensor domain-containing protein
LILKEEARYLFIEMKTYILTLLIIVVFHLPVYNQNYNLSFDHLTVLEGLSQSTIFSITQDKKGFIWIATRNGLNRYDSHEIKTYKNDPNSPSSLPSNTINALLVDSKGQLWVGTNKGVCLYNQENDNFTPIINLSDKGSKPATYSINVIFEDREKNIWIGTRIGLKLLLSGDTARIIPIYHNPKKLESLIDNDVRSIMQDKKGDFWIGTLNGLSHFISKQQNEFTVVNFVSSKNNLNSLSDNWINTIIEGDNETIWFGTEKGGLNIYETKNNIFYSPGNKSQNPLYQNLFSKINMQVRVLKKDNSGQFWIGSRSGFYVFDPSSRQVHEFTINPDSPSSISDNSIRSIFIDRDGSFWIGTFYGGINIFNPMSKQFDHFKQPGVNSPLFYKIASALYEDFRRNIWISVEGKGIMCWNTQENSFKTYKYSAENPNSLSSDNVKCISPDGKEGLWIGTLNGLNYFSFNTNKFTRYFFEKGNPNTIPNDRVYDIESDREGNLWIATNGGGLCRYNKKEKNFETFHYILNNPNTIKTDNLTSLTLDSKNRLWIGATTGLNLRYPNGKIIRFTNINKKKETIDEKYICFVHEDRFKRIWIGTRGNGLFLYDEKTSDFKNYSIDDGLPGNNIIGVLEDEHGFLWLSTENGISKFDTEKNDFKNYTISDGLICKEFNYNSYLKDHTGKMYFGGYNGIVIFNPEDIKVNTAIPTMVFTNLKLFNNNSKKDLKSRISEQDISSSKSITIKSFQNVFTVEFALLNINLKGLKKIGIK